MPRDFWVKKNVVSINKFSFPGKESLWGRMVR